MRKNKLLFILIPVIIILLALLGGFIYLKVNSAPKKIFTGAINKAFEFLEVEEDKYTTVKSKVELSGSIESEDESVKEVKDILENSKITINSELDTKNLFANENIQVVYNNENLINLDAIMQDQKIYIAFRDWLDKYIEVPIEEAELLKLNEITDNLGSIDANLLLKSVQEEFVKEIKKQEFIQEKVKLNLDGKETKVTKSSLKLSEEQATTFVKEFLENLKQNENFQKATGEYKDEIIDEISATLEDLPTEDFNQDTKMSFSIYTKGILNKFVAADFTIEEEEKITAGIEFVKQNKGKYEFAIYENDEEERTNLIKITLNDEKESKNKGTIKISAYFEDEVLDLICKYELKDEQVTFELSTTIENVELALSGNVIEKGNTYSGTLMISTKVQEFGTVNLNFLYNFEYNAQIQKVDVSNSTTIEELNEDDQQTLLNNMQNSKLYELIENNNLQNLISNGNVPTNPSEAKVTKDGQTVVYKVAGNFKENSNSEEDFKQYEDDNYNMIYVRIENKSADEYLKELENEYVLKSDLYKEQEISETSTYGANGKEYKYRTIIYKDKDDNTVYCNLCFAYNLNNGYVFTVEVDTENGNISLDDVNEFLNITIK